MFLLFLISGFLEGYGVLVSAKTVCVTIYVVMLKLKNLSTSFWRWNIRNKAKNQPKINNLGGNEFFF